MTTRAQAAEVVARLEELKACDDDDVTKKLVGAYLALATHPSVVKNAGIWGQIAAGGNDPAGKKWAAGNEVKHRFKDQSHFVVVSDSENKPSVKGTDVKDACARNTRVSLMNFAINAKISEKSRTLIPDGHAWGRTVLETILRCLVFAFMGGDINDAQEMAVLDPHGFYLDHVHYDAKIQNTFVGRKGGTNFALQIQEIMEALANKTPAPPTGSDSAKAPAPAPAKAPAPPPAKTPVAPPAQPSAPPPSGPPQAQPVTQPTTQPPSGGVQPVPALGGSTTVTKYRRMVPTTAGNVNFLVWEEVTGSVSQTSNDSAAAVNKLVTNPQGVVTRESYIARLKKGESPIKDNTVHMCLGKLLTEAVAWDSHPDVRDGHMVLFIKTDAIRRFMAQPLGGMVNNDAIITERVKHLMALHTTEVTACTEAVSQAIAARPGQPIGFVARDFGGLTQRTIFCELLVMGLLSTQMFTEQEATFERMVETLIMLFNPDGKPSYLATATHPLDKLPPMAMSVTILRAANPRLDVYPKIEGVARLHARYSFHASNPEIVEETMEILAKTVPQHPEAAGILEGLAAKRVRHEAPQVAQPLVQPLQPAPQSQEQGQYLQSMPQPSSFTADENRVAKLLGLAFQNVKANRRPTNTTKGCFACHSTEHFVKDCPNTEAKANYEKAQQQRKRKR